MIILLVFSTNVRLGQKCLNFANHHKKFYSACPCSLAAIDIMSALKSLIILKRERIISAKRRVLFYNTFYGPNKLECFSVRVTSSLAQGWSLPECKCKALWTYGQAPGLHCKYQTRVVVTYSDKHSSLLRYGIQWNINAFIVEVRCMPE